jgi:hypothetical protein
MGVFVPLDHQAPAKQRRRILTVDPVMLLGLLSALTPGPRTYSATGLPDDARLIGCAYNVENDKIVLSIESESFAEVPFGYRCEELRVSLTEHF